MKTADLCDDHGDALSVAEPLFLDFGKKTTFFGPITTVKVYEDNTLVRTALSSNGPTGRVLVVDGAGSRRFALVGDRLAELAVERGFAGLVVFGCIRDAAAIKEIPIGLKALGTTPRKTKKQNVGLLDQVVHFAGVDFVPGHYLYADEDGIVVADRAL